MSTKIITICALCVLVLGLGATASLASDIYVDWDGGGDYLTIQEGVDAAIGGDVIHVAGGIYTEQVH